MTKRLILSAVLGLAMLSGASAQERKELHILSANDMHAAIECMPRLGFVADSLRALYPDLLVLSAGDNRSGEPLNDMYEIPAYPMVALHAGYQQSCPVRQNRQTATDAGRYPDPCRLPAVVALYQNLHSSSFSGSDPFESFFGEKRHKGVRPQCALFTSLHIF